MDSVQQVTQTRHPISATNQPIDDCLRKYFLRRRQALLMELNEIEDLLGLEHSRQTKREVKELEGR